MKLLPGDVEDWFEPIEPDDPRLDVNNLSRFIEECERAERDPDVFVDFNGRRFRPPFRCLCCGQPVSLAQFCYGRLCGPCDCGACQSRGLRRYRHPPLARDWYLEISEPAPAEVDATGGAVH